MAWIYNDRTGQINNVPIPLALALTRLNIGWHGPFGTKEQALAFYNDGKATHPGWKAPTGLSEQLSDAAGNIQDRIEQDVFHGIDLQSAILRIAEIMLGIVLVAVGIAKLTGASNQISKLVKVAIPG